MKFHRKPLHIDEGPWGVDSYAGYWYVVHAETLRAKRIGMVNAKQRNYFIEACEEARERNRALAIVLK